MYGVTRAPWSGDVSQAINPWTVFTRVAGSQLGFINIQQHASSDPALEQRIVEEVAGYGRQLGRLTDALRVVIAQLDQQGLDPSQRQALSAFEATAQAIDALKATQRLGGPMDAGTVLAALDRMEAEQPEHYRELRERLKRRLDLREP